MSNMIQLILFSALVLGGFYFILLRPVLNQQRRQRMEMARLRIGDEVLLNSGLIATVVDLQVDDAGRAVMMLDLGGVRVKALPSAILQRWGQAEGPEETGTEAPAEQEVGGGA